MFRLGFPILFLGLVVCQTSFSQRGFFPCEPQITDSIWNAECYLFLNPVTGLIDSLTTLVKDSLIGNDRLIEKAKPIWIRFVHTGNEGKLTYYWEGKLMFAGVIEGGKLNGPFTSFLDGDKITGTFRYGMLHGDLEIDLGNTKEHKSYSMGQLHGPYYEIDEDGKFLFFRMYKDGLMDGMEYKLHGNGMLHYFMMNEKGNPKDGEYFVFDSEGKTVAKLTFKDGMRLNAVEAEKVDRRDDE